MALSITDPIGDRVIPSPRSGSQFQVESGAIMHSTVRFYGKTARANNGIRLVVGSIFGMLFLVLAGTGALRAETSVTGTTMQVVSIDKPDVNDWG
ncbi:hypothetical protein [Streptomyces sp. NPDC002156]